MFCFNNNPQRKKDMNISKFEISPKEIKFSFDEQTDQGVRTVTCRSTDAPLASLRPALEGLSDVVADLLELDPEWAGAGLVTGVQIKYSAAGTRALQLVFVRSVAVGLVSFKTPFFLLDEPAEDEEGSCPLHPHLKDKCLAALAEVEKYVNGERQQMTLDGVMDSGNDSEHEPDDLGLGDFDGGETEQQEPDEDPKPKSKAGGKTTKRKAKAKAK